MKYCFTIIIFLTGLKFSFSQTATNKQKTEAVMLVHFDWSNYLPMKWTDVSDSILSDYSVRQLKHNGIFDCVFLEITSSGDEANKDWSFVLAYSSDEHRFFRLRGFKYNEFNEFYDLVLNSGSLTLVSAKGKRKRLKQIAEQVEVEGYDIKEAYKKYYGKYKACLVDETSNYRKLIIRAY